MDETGMLLDLKDKADTRQVFVNEARTRLVHLQLHLRQTGGPGWRVWSMNSYTR